MITEGHPTRYRGPVKAIVLDWAGTAIDFGSCAPVAAFVEAFARCGVSITAEQARGPMGMAKRDHIAAIGRDPAVAEAWRAAHGRAFTGADVDTIYAEFLPAQLDCLAQYAKLIPGCAEAVETCRQRGIRFGSSTGYTRELMDIVTPLAEQQGFRPDVVLCASDIAEGRPAPWLIFENARRLGVYPMAAVVKVDDTIVGVQAGLNAGVWTVGVARTGNLVGLKEKQLDALDPAEQQSRVEAARWQLTDAGAHLVIESVAELPEAVAAIEARLKDGDRP